MRAPLFLLVLSLLLPSAHAAQPCIAAATYRSPNPTAEQQFQTGLRDYIQRNYSAARYYFTLAARENHPRAEELLGMMDMQGKAGPVDTRDGLRLLTESGQQGHRGANLNLGLYYSDVVRNYPTADRYLLASAECGDVDAEIELALNYEFARGVPWNRKAAIYWLMKAAPSNGLAHLVADFLANPSTPHFQSAGQLGTYIGEQIHQTITLRMPHPRFGVGPCGPGAYGENGHCYQTDDPTHTPVR